MKLMLVLMGNAESFEMARPLLHTLAGAGVEVTLVHYASDEVVPVDDLIATGARYIPLSDDGFGSIPRLSRRQYQALCGDDLDFLGAQYHNIAQAGFAPTRDFLFGDSMFHQWFHGFAYRAEVLMRECRPDVVVVNHGSEPISKIVYAKARKLGLPALLIESSFVPGRILLDNVGMHFFPGQNRIEREWPRVRETPLTTEQQARLDAYLDAWRSRGVSKYAQAESAEEVRALRDFAAEGRRLLFVVDQVPFDANILNGNRAFESFGPMVDMARSELPEDWSAVYKLHPRNPSVADVPTGRQSDRFLTVRDLNIHRVFQSCDAVLTYSSNVGMEALAYEKPVIVGGRPHYGDRGLTLDLERIDEFPRLLAEATRYRPDRVTRDRFLHHVLFEYLIDANDASALLRRIEEARGTDFSPNPFSAHHVERFAKFRARADDYNRLANENLDHEEIIRRLALTPEGGGPEWSRLDSGERQVAIDHGGVAENHLIRYRLARELVQPGMDVLDLSCGIGYGTALLAEGTGARRVVGVDCSESAVAFAREFWARPNVEYVRSSAGAFELEADSFDLIVSYETVEHLANDRAFVDRLWRALRPGGVLLLSAPHQNGYAMRAHEFHVQHYTAESLLDLLNNRPGLAGTMVLGQVGDTRIEGRAGGKHLIAVARRAVAGEGDDVLRDRLGALLPYTKAGAVETAREPIRIRAHHFRVEGGRLENGRVVAGSEVENQHVVAGPYYRLTPGRHAAGFLLGVEGEVAADDGPGVVLDVAEGDGRVLARLALRRAHLRELTRGRRMVVLPFRHENPLAVLQFRIYVEGRPLRGRLEFFGVELRAAAMRDDADGTGSEGPPRDPFAEGFEVMDLVAVERQRLDEATAELAALREQFSQFQDHFQHTRNDWTNLFRETDRRLRVTEEERNFLTWERGEIAREHDELRARFEELARERETWGRACEALRLERDASVGQLAEAQGRLRPYVIVDRIGVVPRSLGLASKLRRKLGA